MPALTTVAQGSERPVLTITWTHADNSTGENLTGAALTGYVKNMATDALYAIQGTLAVTDAANGVFTWTPDPFDVAEFGTYQVQFNATFAGEPTPALTAVFDWEITESIIPTNDPNQYPDVQGVVKLLVRTTDPDPSATGYIGLWAKADGLYLTDSAGVTQGPFSDGSAAVAAHVLEADPHTQYLTSTEGDLAYSAIGHDHAGVYAPVSHSHATGDVTGLAEYVQDTAAAMITGATHTNVSVSYDDGTGLLAITASPTYTDEQAQDAAAAAFAAGTHTNITVTYDDAGNAISLAGAAAYTDEQAQDAAASLFTTATHDGASVLYTDAAGTLAITNSDKGSTAVASHLLASNPHPEYLTPAEGDLAYSALGHLHDDRYYTETELSTSGQSSVHWGNVASNPVSLDHMDAITSAARLYGGAITSNGDGTVAIAAGSGLIKADEAGPEDLPASETGGQSSAVSRVTWNAVASLALTDNAYNYVYFDGTDSTVKATTDFYSISFTQSFTMGRCYRVGNVITIRLCGTNAWNFNRRVQLFGEEMFPVVRATGLMLSATGTRNIAFTEGVLWAELVNRFSVAAFDSSAGGTFTYWYRATPSGWTSVAAQTQINNLNYDDGDGTLGTLTANRYGVHWVYVVHDDSVHVVYGQGDYSLTQAEAATPPATIPGLLAAYATLIGKITVQKSSDTLTVESAFTTTFAGTGVIYHNDLSGVQGGAANDYYHLTGTHHTDLTDGGSTTLHTHDSLVPKSLFDAKGDLVVATANDTPAKLTVGTDGYILTAASAQTPGVAWAVNTPAWDNVTGKPSIYQSTLFLHNTAADVATYLQALTVPSPAAETSATGVANSGTGEVLIKAFITSQMGVSVINGNAWSFKTYAKVESAVGVSQIVVRVYARDTGGTETELFNTSSAEINATVATLYEIDTVQTSFDVLPTDRMVIKYFAKTTSGGDRTITLYYQGAENASHAATPVLFASLTVATDTLWDAKGDLAVGTGNDTATVLPVGTDTYILTANSAATNGIEWAAIPDQGGIAESLIDAKGDLIVGSAADTAAKLTVGTDTYVLTANSAATNGVEWAAPTGSGIPETIVAAKGDLIAATANDTVDRLGVGTNGYVLTAASGQATGLQWAAIPDQGGIPETLIDAKGDLIVGSAADSAARLAVGGTDGHVLTVDAAATNGIKWAAVTIPTGAITRYLTLGRGGTLTVAEGSARLYVPFACTISNVRANVGTAPTGASLIVDVHLDGTTIFTTQGNRPTITATNFTDLTNTPDVTSISANSYLTVSVDQIGSTIAGADLCVVVEVTA